MIQIIDNFDHRSKLPNFARDSFATLQEMRSCPDSDIDEGHISYCVATNKHYKFNSSNSADETIGKWREWKGEKVTREIKVIKEMMDKVYQLTLLHLYLHLVK